MTKLDAEALANEAWDKACVAEFYWEKTAFVAWLAKEIMDQTDKSKDDLL